MMCICMTCCFACDCPSIFVHFQEHKKQYGTIELELHRHTIWQSNKKFIDEHNEHADVFGYTVAMNEFGDLVSGWQLFN